MGEKWWGTELAVDTDGGRTISVKSANGFSLSGTGVEGEPSSAVKNAEPRFELMIEPLSISDAARLWASSCGGLGNAKVSEGEKGLTENGEGKSRL